MLLRHRSTAMKDLDESTLSRSTYKVLYQIAERATSGESLFAFSKEMHRLLAELLPLKNLYVCLLNADQQSLHYLYFVDERDGIATQIDHVPMRRGLTEFVLRTETAQLISKSRYAALRQGGYIAEACGDPSFSNWIGVPLRLRGKTAGVLSVLTCATDISWGKAELQLLSLVSKHVRRGHQSPPTPLFQRGESWTSVLVCLHILIFVMRAISSEKENGFTR